MRALIAEDDRSVAAALKSVLGRAGYDCTHVTRGSDVLLRHREAEVVLLDLGLEDGDAFETLRRLREVDDIPVVVITARGDERSTVRALRSGADDYLVKPVRLRELLARLEAVTRRREPATAGDEIELGDVRVETAAHRVVHAGGEVQLTPTEFELLVALARHRGHAVSRQQVLDDVWGDAYAARSRSLDVHLAQLRQKLPMLTITTLRGLGYRLEAVP